MIENPIMIDMVLAFEGYRFVKLEDCDDRSRRREFGGELLVADAEFGDQPCVAGVIFSFQITKQSLASSDEFEKTEARGVVFFVLFEVIGQIVDAIGQKGDLYFRRTGIVLTASEFLDDFELSSRIQSHC